MYLKSNLSADAALVVTTLIWGSTFVMAKDVLDYWPPLAYIAFRLSLAAVVLVAVFWREVVSAGRSEWMAGVVLGLLIGSGFAGQAVGQVYTTPAKSAFVTGLTTPLVPFVAYLLLGAKPSIENLIGIVLASIGGGLILAPQGTGDGVNVGDLITLGCTVMFATHIAFMSLYTRTYGARQMSALQLLVAGGLVLAVYLGFRLYANLEGTLRLPEVIARESASLVWSGGVVVQLLYLAIVATVITFILWSWGQSRVSATHAAIIFSLEPVFATLFAVAVRGSDEWIGGRATFGAALVVAGVIVSELRLSALKERPDEADAATLQ